MSVLFAGAARAEPAPTWLYADPTAGTCGELWGGDEREEREPASPFRRLDQLPLDDPALCRRALASMPARGLRPATVNDPGAAPCDTLRWRLERGEPDKGNRAAVCVALGYRFIGEIPFVARPGPAVAAEEKARRLDRVVRALAVGLAVLVAVAVAVMVRRRARYTRSGPP
jgi:hypothetical protein